MLDASIRKLTLKTDGKRTQTKAGMMGLKPSLKRQNVRWWRPLRYVVHCHLISIDFKFCFAVSWTSWNNQCPAILPETNSYYFKRWFCVQTPKPGFWRRAPRFQNLAGASRGQRVRAPEHVTPKSFSAYAPGGGTGLTNDRKTTKIFFREWTAHFPGLLRPQNSYSLRGISQYSVARRSFNGNRKRQYRVIGSGSGYCAL